MIPKIIHYCWFGKNEKSGMIKACIASWKKNLPDYKIIEWNEDNFEVNAVNYSSQAYKAGKWAFVSDYARLSVLYNIGGIYFDTDVEVLKPFPESFLECNAFTGFESKDSPVTAVMGSEKGNNTFKMLLDYYSSADFINPDGTYNEKTNTHILSEILRENGIKPNGKNQTVNDFTVYPQIYFCPNNLSRIWGKPSHKSYAIHHFDQSWKSEKTDSSSLKSRIRRYAIGVARDLVGTKRLESIRDRKNK